MSAPIDDLLYGGDDSGDEDELNAMPMSSFSAPLPSTGALPLVAPPPGVLGPPAGVVGPVPPPMNAASVSAPVASLAPASASTAPRPTSAGAAGAGPVKQPGSGHQMFQQMFALLKQMLPPEQYAALHSEMRNGNGNDIKSIVDIIKRIAGDAIFASVIQRMDLTRNQSAAAGSLGIVKNEPALAAGQTAAAAAAGIPMGTPPASASTTPAGAGARTAPVARPLATPPPSASLAQPPTMTPSPPIASAAAPPTAVQRPTLVAATPPLTAVKAEPSSTFTPSPSVPVATATPAPTTATPAAPVAAAPLTAGDASSATGGKNDTQEKIQFAKKLLFHASSCTLPPGTCQVKRCDDVRRVFKHSVSCSTRSCSHCRQLRALVEYHAKECHVPVGEHCKIPFCDAIRRNNAAARARAVSVGNNATTAAPSTSAVTATATTTASAATAAVSATTAATAPSASTMSSDDEDNTPLASAMTKVKKNAKAKSPKSGPVSAGSSSSAAAAKKKSAAKPASSTPTSTASTPSSTGSSTPAAAAAAAAKPKPSGTLTQAQEYGRLLQIILHVEKCKSSACAVGEECVEAKTLLRQVNSPDAPARAQTFKKVFAHYKVCLAKNNTQNCPMCKIGLQPIDTSSGSSAAATTSGAATTAPISVSSSAASSAAPSAPTSSPTVAALKRTNSSVASPRSPSKKPRVTTKGSGKTSNDSTTSTTAASAAASAAAAADQHSSDLSSTNRNDLRKEEDVLTHTGIDLNTERRAMMMDRFGNKPKKIPEQLHSTKHAWLQNDLFQNDKLTRHMERIARQQGVSLGGSSAATTKIMAHALQEYLKQVMEEMVEAATLRGDVTGQAVDALVKKDLGGSTAPRELTSTDILRVSCDDSFARLRHDDIALRTSLLEEAKREELAEKERSKKRKKVDRVKLQAQEEKDEAEMDIEELAIKDLKERLLQEDKGSVVRVDGRVNESLTSKFQRRVDHQVTIEDASYWLENQKPYINTKLFVRAEAARIVTNALL